MLLRAGRGRLTALRPPSLLASTSAAHRRRLAVATAARRSRASAGGDAGDAAAAAEAEAAATAAAAPHARALLWLADRLDEAGAAYMLRGACAAWVQGCAGVPLPGAEAADGAEAAAAAAAWDVEVQWDALVNDSLAAKLGAPAGAVERVPGGHELRLARGGVPLRVFCRSSTVVAARADRVAALLDASPAALPPSRAPPALLPPPPPPPQQQEQPHARRLWVQSLHSVRDEARGAPGAAGAALAAAVGARLAALQARMAAHNARAWAGEDTYASWVARFGSPAEAAARIAADPTARLAPLDAHLPRPLAGARVANLLASHGGKAVAMALLGADVTCIDISKRNAAYARDLAEAAGVAGRVRYVVADVLSPPRRGAGLAGAHDACVAELGVLHYFADLEPFMAAAAALLRPRGGRLVLRDFHPVSTKLLESAGKRRLARRKAGGAGGGAGGAGGGGGGGASYFDESLAEAGAAFAKWAAPSGAGGAAAAPTPAAPSVLLRRWTLGEVVGAAAAAGLHVERLLEEPSPALADAGLPKMFTLVAIKR